MSCLEVEYRKILEVEYGKIIKEVNNAVKGLKGYDRAIGICEFFEEQGEHPHAIYTFNQMAMNRTSDYKFAIELKDSMAYLVATNRLI